MKVKLDLNEIKRYLNYQSANLDETTSQNIEKALILLDENASFKYVYQRYPITIIADEVIIEKTTLKFKSKSLANHLKECDEVILLVATLGLTLDKQIKKLEITDLGLGYVLNGVAVEYIEKCLDEIQINLVDDKYQTSRYSIGYGDLALTYQNEFINVLEATKKIGVNVLDTHLMVPSKSVSAIIGLSVNEVNNNLEKCPNCLPNGHCSGRCLGKE